MTFPSQTGTTIKRMHLQTGVSDFFCDGGGCVYVCENVTDAFELLPYGFY